jgi:hypothetical protein
VKGIDVRPLLMRPTYCYEGYWCQASELGSLVSQAQVYCPHYCCGLLCLSSKKEGCSVQLLGNFNSASSHHNLTFMTFMGLSGSSSIHEEDQSVYRYRNMHQRDIHAILCISYFLRIRMPSPVPSPNVFRQSCMPHSAMRCFLCFCLCRALHGQKYDGSTLTVWSGIVSPWVLCKQRWEASSFAHRHGAIS